MGTENGRRKCGRKKTKSSEAGKIPQRGMGVAQLEWHRRHPSSGDGSSKKEITNQNPNMFHSFAPQMSHPYGPNSCFSTNPSVHSASRGLGAGLNQQQQGLVVHQRLGPNGLVVGQGQSNSGFGYVYPDQFPVLDQYGVVGAPQYSYYQQPNTGNMNMSISTCEMSKDMISYVPNMQCFPAAVTVCPKKKRYTSGEISESVVVTAKDSYGSTFIGSPMISCAAKGTYNLQDCGGTTKLSSMHPYFPGPKINDIQDAVAVQDCKAKGSFMGGSRNMLMEYHEFFPAAENSKLEKSSIFKDWIKLGSESSSAGGGYGEAANSCLTTTNTSSVAFGGASTSIDLSLKLSNY